MPPLVECGSRESRSISSSPLSRFHKSRSTPPVRRNPGRLRLPMRASRIRRWIPVYFHIKYSKNCPRPPAPREPEEPSEPREPNDPNAVRRTVSGKHAVRPVRQASSRSRCAPFWSRKTGNRETTRQMVSRPPMYGAIAEGTEAAAAGCRPLVGLCPAGFDVQLPAPRPGGFREMIMKNNGLEVPGTSKPEDVSSPGKDMTLEEYKQYLYKQISQIPIHRTRSQVCAGGFVQRTSL